MTYRLVHALTATQMPVLTQSMVRTFASVMCPDRNVDLPYSQIQRLAIELTKVSIPTKTPLLRAAFSPALEMKNGTVGDRIVNELEGLNSLPLTHEIAKVLAGAVIGEASSDEISHKIAELDSAFRQISFKNGTDNDKSAQHHFVPSVALQ